MPRRRSLARSAAGRRLSFRRRCGRCGPTCCRAPPGSCARAAASKSTCGCRSMPRSPPSARPTFPPSIADMNRYTVSEGIALDGDATGGRIVAGLPGDIRARRASLDLATLDPSSRLACSPFAAHVDRSAAAPDARIVGAGGAAGLGRQGLLPPVPDAAAMAALTRRLRAEGWLRPGCRRPPRCSACRPTRRSRSSAPPGPAPRRHGFRALSRAARPAARRRRSRPRSRPPPIPTGRDDGDVRRRSSTSCWRHPAVLLRLSLRHGLVLDGGRPDLLLHPRAPSAAAGPAAGRSTTGRRSRSSCPATTRATTPRRRSATAAGVDYPDFEVIAINDGSRDNTAEVLDRLVGQHPAAARRPSRRRTRARRRP